MTGNIPKREEVREKLYILMRDSSGLKDGINSYQDLTDETILGMPDDSIPAGKTYLEFDSLDLVELTMSIEDKYFITFPEKETEKLRTVGDTLDLILKLSK